MLFVKSEPSEHKRTIARALQNSKQMQKYIWDLYRVFQQIVPIQD